MTCTWRPPAYNRFLANHPLKYPKACDCLQKDKRVLFIVARRRPGGFTPRLPPSKGGDSRSRLSGPRMQGLRP
jgi:hypothetical protein